MLKIQLSKRVLGVVAAATWLVPLAAADTDSPVGTYIIENITETVNGFSCSTLQQAGESIDCEATRLTQYRADGTVVSLNRWSPGSFLTDSAGFWKQKPNGKVVGEQIFQIFGPDGNEAGFVLAEYKLTFASGYDTFSGSFESKSYVEGQDPLDEFSAPSGILIGSVTGRRVYKR